MIKLYLYIYIYIYISTLYIYICNNTNYNELFIGSDPELYSSNETLLRIIIGCYILIFNLFI